MKRGVDTHYINIYNIIIYIDMLTAHSSATPISHTPNGQYAGDLTPNAHKREKGPKCGSLPLNAGELAALLQTTHKTLTLYTIQSVRVIPFQPFSDMWLA